jgi:hypothetical protein
VITNNYSKSWFDIKKSALLKTSILKDFEADEIKYHIKKERQNINRQKGAQNKSNDHL